MDLVGRGVHFESGLGFDLEDHVGVGNGTHIRSPSPQVATAGLLLRSHSFGLADRD
jgi:hypothetical protein